MNLRPRKFYVNYITVLLGYKVFVIKYILINNETFK